MFSWSGVDIHETSLVWQDPAGAAARSLDDFASQAAAWGQAVLSFPQFQDLEPDEAIKLFSDMKIEWISSEEWKMG